MNNSVNLSELVVKSNNVLYTTSSILAKAFGRTHSSIIAQIKNLSLNYAGFGNDFIRKTNLTDKSIGFGPHYFITYKGFDALVKYFPGSELKPVIEHIRFVLGGINPLFPKLSNCLMEEVAEVQILKQSHTPAEHPNALALLQSGNPYPIDFNEAWQWVGYARKDAAKRKLEDSFTQGLDYQVSLNPVENSVGGRPSENIQLTLDCFKAFALMAATVKGRDVRTYFIECEKQLIGQSKPALPTAKQLALLVLQSEEEKERLALELASIQEAIEAQKPKVEFADLVANSSGCLKVGEFAKTIPGTGQNRFFEFLRKQGVLMSNKGSEQYNLPYQAYIERGLFKVIEEPLPSSTAINPQMALVTVITGKGQLYLSNLWSKKGAQ